jgi:hypothetical protein
LDASDSDESDPLIFDLDSEEEEGFLITSVSEEGEFQGQADE